MWPDLDSYSSLEFRQRQALWRTRVALSVQGFEIVRVLLVYHLLKNAQTTLNRAQWEGLSNRELHSLL